MTIDANAHVREVLDGIMKTLQEITIALVRMAATIETLDERVKGLERRSLSHRVMGSRAGR